MIVHGLNIIQKRSITTQKAMAVLEKHGIILTEKEGEEVLNLLYLLSETVVKMIDDRKRKLFKKRQRIKKHFLRARK